MGKIVFVLVNFLFLLGYNIYFGGEVSVEQKMPESIAAGDKFTIEVTLNKGDREGFAKWQQELPVGFIATPMETQGATFSFKKQSVKLIWMALPDNESFTISYEVQADPSINGSFSFNGKFSYIENNERKDIVSESSPIQIGEGGAVLASKEPSKKEDAAKEETGEIINPEIAAVAIPEKSTNEDVAQEPNMTNSSENEKTNQKLVTSQEGIEIKRSVNRLEGANYEVTLTIQKGENQSFGKVEEYVPPGYIAMEKESKDGIYSFNNNVMKILWMSLPAGNTIELTYLLQSESDELDSATIHGVFSFLKDDQSYQLAMGPSRFKNYFMEEETVTEEVKEEVSTLPAVAVAVETSQSEETKEEIAEISNIPSAETGITYKVQIAAGKNEVNQQYFIDRHSIRETVSTEYHNSWFKYTVGGYDMYKQARDKRNAIWAAENKIKDAFVSAYNSGERISVQEALMISNQKWIK